METNEEVPGTGQALKQGIVIFEKLLKRKACGWVCVKVSRAGQFCSQLLSQEGDEGAELGQRYLE